MSGKEEKLHKLHIGTSGWSYKHWAGIFYPEGLKPAKWLEYYLLHFQCVELNSSFYHLPRESTVAGWLHRVPEDFIFCPKLSRYITHRQKLQDSGGSLERFFDVFSALKPRLGPVLVQFPPGMGYDKNKVDGFFTMLHDNYPEYRFAVEVRHPSWFNDTFYNLLEKNNAAFVIADSGKRYPYQEVVTARYVYLRFHGREKLYASDYSIDTLKAYSEKIIQWLTDNREVWVFFNNDFNGYALRNASTLSDLIMGPEIK